MAVLEILTDEDILDYTRRGTKNFVLTTHKDANLKFKSLVPIRGGVYDVEIFGSPYRDRCICGKVRTISNEPCPECGAVVYSKIESLRRFARIELPFYYLNSMRYEVFLEFINRIFPDKDFQFSDATGELYKIGSRAKLTQKVFDSCQFEWDDKNKTLIVSDIITDESKCSYEGLLKILEEYKPNEVKELKTYINRLYLVMPVAMRPPSYISRNGKNPELGTKSLTTWYQIILRFMCSANEDAGSFNYDTVMSKFKTPGERVKYTALLRALLEQGIKNATDLLNSSKENLARDLYSIRTNNSGRCPIVPSVDLPIDEVKIPIHLAYEVCRSGFIKYLMNELNFSEEQAELSTRVEATNPEMMRLFKKYAESRVVIINRAPSLHEYNLIACKLRLTPNYTMELPILLCSQLAGDFDGDALVFHLVPEELQDEVMEKLSMRNLFFYHKNLEPIICPSHEFLKY